MNSLPCRCLPILISLLLVGCGAEPVDLQPSIAIIYGSVRDADDTPVSGATVAIHALPLDRCDEQEGWLAVTTTTDPAGTYRGVGAYVHVAEETLCLAVRVRPPASTSLGEAVVTGDTVTFIHESRTPPVDSVRVDVMLPAAGA